MGLAFGLLLTPVPAGTLDCGLGLWKPQVSGLTLPSQLRAVLISWGGVLWWHTYTASCFGVSW